LPLARELLGAAAARLGRSVTGFTPAVAELLMRHQWPGNVRELENAMERGVALARGAEVEAEDLPDELRGALRPVTVQGTLTLADVERAHILETLELHGGNQTRTARALQIGSSTLYRKLRSYGHVAARGSNGDQERGTGRSGAGEPPHEVRWAG
jgi:DNA-binding NtrC family response regulator